MTRTKKTTPADTEIVVQENQTTQIVPQEKEIVKEMDIDGFLYKRQEFIEKVNKIMVEGKDYHVIQNKKSLAKGGAEKIASIFGWTASFKKDAEVAESFGDIKGLISFVCDLHKHNELVGQGRGASTLARNNSDPNKTIKMAQKSAFIDAVIRASGMSDFFTQDLEDMNVNDISQSQTTSYPPSEKQINLIKQVMEQKNVTEEMLIDEGFDLKNLTGGKEGTASEVIEWLFAYKPTFEQGQGKSNYKGSSGLSSPKYEADIDLGQRIDKCDTLESLDLMAKEVMIAYNNKKITKDQLEILKNIGAQRRAELSKLDPETQKIADSIKF